MPATVVRAAIMGSVFLVAELLGRQRNSLAALMLTAALMVAVEPRVLWDISFQLSLSLHARHGVDLALLQQAGKCGKYSGNRTISGR